MGWGNWFHDVVVDNVERRLGGAVAGLDYTVLYVGLFTLGLILFVEIVRHHIDHKCQGRPFAETVLGGVYGELSTLGIVEFGIFLLVNYYKGFNLVIEAVFAKVHFLLFFTAMINALMSVLLAFFSSRIAHERWVKCEKLELDHYIAIREELLRVEKLLGERVCHDTVWEKKHPFQTFWNGLVLLVQYPALKRQHKKLLGQIRFHELRVYFIRSHDLPPTFKVSDYLIKSQLHVFQECVHISTYAWLLVAAALNLCYYLMGMVQFVSEDSQVTGAAMTWIFVALCVGFILISEIIGYKMSSVFDKIMTMRLIDFSGSDDDAPGFGNSNFEGSSIAGGSAKQNVNNALAMRSFARREKKVDQRDLFWFGDPHLMVAAFQFMQLGYAIGISIILIFWKQINVYYGEISGLAFVLVLLFCYLIFLFVISNVVPKYTLCTSLGQLVDRRRLHETLSKCKLEEARRKRLRVMEERDYEMAMEKKHKAKKARREAAREKREGEKLAKLVDLVEAGDSDLPAVKKTLEEIKKERKGNLVKTLSGGVVSMATFSKKGRERAGSQSSGAASMALDDDTANSAGYDGRLTDPESIEMMRANKKDGIKRSGSTGFLEAEGNDKSRKSSTTKSFRRSNSANDLKNDALSKGDDSTRLESDVSVGSLGGYADELDDAFADVLSPGSIRSNSSGLSHWIYIPSFDLEKILTSGKYTLVSACFGTMIAFFLVGMRVEVMLLHAQALKDLENTSHLDLIQSFWWEAGWLMLFIAVSTLTIFVFSCRCGKAPRWDMIIAGACDVFLSGLCLILLFWAESKRCCEGVSSYDSYDKGYSSESSSSYNDYGASDQAYAGNYTGYGDGNYTGYGTKENSATSDFNSDGGRRFLAAAVDDGCNRLLGEAATEDPCYTPCNRRFLGAATDDKDACYESCGRRFLGEAPSGPDPCTSIYQGVDECTCPRFGSRIYGGLGNIEPFTALICLRVFRFQFGRFLSTIRQRYEDWQHSKDPYYKDVLNVQKVDVAANIDDEVDAAKQFHCRHAEFEHQSGTAVDLWKKATGLYPEISEKYGEFSSELLQAMLGIEVVHGCNFLSKNSDDPPPIQDISVPAVEQGGANAENAGPNKKMDMDRPSIDPTAMLINPSARLIRSMRRCERRLSPMLKDWAVVDVAITKHEIVYFDASPGSQDVDLTKDVERLQKTTKDALLATRGGRGLRLCDIAAGRKIVGHLELADVTSIKVERFEKRDEGAAENPDVEEDANDIDLEHEYWKEARASGRPFEPRSYRWKHSNEDRLVLTSIQGNLQLRFFADLEDWETTDHEQNEGQKGAKFLRTDALLWCQTVGRLVGIDNLQQKIPHFGKGGNEELLDYLDFIARDLDETDPKDRVERTFKKVAHNLHHPHLPHMHMPHPHMPHFNHGHKRDSKEDKKQGKDNSDIV